VYSGNAAVMAAAEAATDTILADKDTMYPALWALADRLAAGLTEILARAGVAHVVQHVGPMVSLFLTSGDVAQLHDYRDVRRQCDFERYIAWQHALQRSGVYFHPNQFEPMFLSTAHRAQDIDEALERFEAAAAVCSSG